jgi:hypothetical protein
MEVYNRLLPIYEARNQKLIAICPTEDSTAIRELLEKEQLQIPLVSTDSLLNCSFFQLGISPNFMPFKIFYDSTGTAIYMRGANNTPESHADFERAALRLSDMAAGLNPS